MTAKDEPTKPDRKTTAILDAAKAHFAKHGFEATKLSDVARDAGVAVGTIYLRYPGKTELLAGTLETIEATFSNAMNAAAIWDQPFPQRFHALMRAVIETAHAQKDLGAVMALAPYVPNQRGKSESKVVAAIERHLADGQAKGQLRQQLDIPLVSRLAHGMVEGALMELMTNPARSASNVIDELVYASDRWLGPS